MSDRHPTRDIAAEQARIFGATYDALANAVLATVDDVCPDADAPMTDDQRTEIVRRVGRLLGPIFGDTPDDTTSGLYAVTIAGTHRAQRDVVVAAADEWRAALGDELADEIEAEAAP